MDTEHQPLTRVEQKQQTLADMARMIARRQYHALFVLSSGGAGKSRTITRTLTEEGQDIFLVNSHCTALQLFRILYQQKDNADAVLFFDDCDSLYTSAPALGLLRSALFGQPNRIVTYNSSALPNDLPPRFETISRFIFCANEIPKKNPMFDAVMTRCLVYRMELNNAEIIEQFRVLSENGYPGCPPEAAAEIVDFIEQQSGERALSMRLLTPAVRIYKFCTEQGSDWRPVLLAQLQTLGRPAASSKRHDHRERETKWLTEAISKFPDSPVEQCRLFMELSGRSRATFYRVLARHNRQGD